jgi:hypothetical protein
VRWADAFVEVGYAERPEPKPIFTLARVPASMSEQELLRMAEDVFKALGIKIRE